MCILIFFLFQQMGVQAQFYGGLFSSANFRQKIDYFPASYYKHINYAVFNSTLGFGVGYNLKKVNFDLSIFRSTSNTKEKVYRNAQDDFKNQIPVLNYTDYTKGFYWAINPNIGYYFWAKNKNFKIRLNIGVNLMLKQSKNLFYGNHKYSAKRVIDSSGEVQYVDYATIQNTAFTSNIALEYKIHKFVLLLNLGLNYKFDFLDRDQGKLSNAPHGRYYYDLWEVNVWQLSTGVGIRRTFSFGGKK